MNAGDAQRDVRFTVWRKQEPIKRPVRGVLGDDAATWVEILINVEIDFARFEGRREIGPAGD